LKARSKGGEEAYRRRGDSGKKKDPHRNLAGLFSEGEGQTVSEKKGEFEGTKGERGVIPSKAPGREKNGILEQRNRGDSKKEKEEDPLWADPSIFPGERGGRS